MSVSEMPQVWTDFGFARVGLVPPRETDLHWVKMPEKHVYTWDGDGWYRIDPPELQRFKEGDLDHG